MPLEIHPATAADTPTLATLFFTTFSDAFNTKLFPRTPDLLKVVDTEADAAKNEPSIVGFALWSLPAPETTTGAEIEEELEDGLSPPWPESCDGAFCERFFGRNHERQVEVMGDKRYYYVDVLGTHPAARRRGVATMLINWGLERAKEEGLEVYLSATQDGRFVYEKLGFEARSTVEVDGYVQDSMVWVP
ncbi:acetyltransferase, GNAT family [Aspergillus nomiae NRRL 13137]|uniref:Acetyltransferase, GNAT family n=1 Tax=Aspergillus nomiae NRRL (strain ATCC 15546 / NRRL 13137 / CBS 260.88 / M93) TaxID=1509407 RepID=A0A0L1IZS6_ASPN3|nr:acetyltransferase, GNAT family [Aspergillus nomiae NRRL 13137]KNG84920.1 acetyltransferase, GNAT family [Aspergillus nomiae NRRL 13137]